MARAQPQRRLRSLSPGNDELISSLTAILRPLLLLLLDGLDRRGLAWQW